MKTLRVVFLLFLFAIAVGWVNWKLPVVNAQQASGQSAPAASDPLAQVSTPVIKAESRLVLVDTIVTDKHGNYVRDLTQKDFKVFEDDKEQTVKRSEEDTSEL